MQLLQFKINNVWIDVDIDDKTIIGIDIQAFNFKEPGERKVNVSNTFTIPKTLKNYKTLGYPGNPQSTNDLVYNSLQVKYYVDNLLLIDGKARIETINNERIGIAMFNKDNFWDRLSKIGMMPHKNPETLDPNDEDYVLQKEGYFKYYNDQHNLTNNTWAFQGSRSSHLTYDTSQFFELNTKYIDTDGITKVEYVSGLIHQVRDVFLNVSNWFDIEFETRLTYEWNFPFTITTHDSINQIVTAENYKVDFPTFLEVGDSVQALDVSLNRIFYFTVNNIVDNGDRYILTMKTTEGGNEYISTGQQLNSKRIYSNYAGSSFINEYTFVFLTIPVPCFQPNLNYKQLEYFPERRVNDSLPGQEPSYKTVSAVDYADKTLYDLFMSVFKIFNVIIDKDDNEDISTYSNTTKKTINLRRLSLINQAPVVEWNTNFVNDYTFKPILDNSFKQTNAITYSTSHPVSSIDSSKVIIKCDNKNLDLGSDKNYLFQIDGYIPAFEDVGGGVNFPSFVGSNDYKTFTFLYIYDGFTTYGAHYFLQDGFEVKAWIGEYADCWKVELFDLNKLYNAIETNYQTLQDMVRKPVVYEVERWMTLEEIYNLKFWRRYKIDHLGGYFFINKISGFNPANNNSPVKIELIKIQ